MIPTASDPVSTLVFFLVVFGVVGAFFLFIHLVMGSVIRPNRPDAEKLTIYECGEPTVGSAWIQFDLRFYVVALLFVIFDVEVAFFFPWATVFGTANQISNLHGEMSRLQQEEKDLNPKKLPLKELSEADRVKQDKIDVQLAVLQEQQRVLSEKLKPSGLSDDARQKLALTRLNKATGKVETVPIEPADAGKWAMVAFFDILIFFAVLMVGFAYVWRRGDIDWVRAYAHHKEPAMEKERPLEQKVGA